MSVLPAAKAATEKTGEEATKAKVAEKAANVLDAEKPSLALLIHSYFTMNITSYEISAIMQSHTVIVKLVAEVIVSVGCYKS